MEFHEKLQKLRKKQNLTQEQLAQQLFVSRTAISKWESGRGYPNLESLKSISGLFSVSIDELLSNDELLEPEKTENPNHIGKIPGFMFGGLNLITVVLLFMPLCGEREGGYIRAVTLLEYTGMTNFLRTLCIGILVTISVFGIIELVVERKENKRVLRQYRLCSMALYAASVMMFALSRQPYFTAFLFLLFVGKAALIVRENQ